MYYFVNKLIQRLGKLPTLIRKMIFRPSSSGHNVHMRQREEQKIYTNLKVLYVLYIFFIILGPKHK